MFLVAPNSFSVFFSLSNTIRPYAHVLILLLVLLVVVVVKISYTHVKLNQVRDQHRLEMS